MSIEIGLLNADFAGAVGGDAFDDFEELLLVLKVEGDELELSALFHKNAAVAVYHDLRDAFVAE